MLTNTTFHEVRSYPLPEPDENGNDRQPLYAVAVYHPARGLEVAVYLDYDRVKQGITYFANRIDGRVKTFEDTDKLAGLRWIVAVGSGENSRVSDGPEATWQYHTWR